MEEFPNAIKENSNYELTQLSQDRIDFKLSLRKKKFNDILIKKRIFPSKPEESPWTLELFLSNLKLPDEYKKQFTDEEELILVAKGFLKSEKILEVKYGICLIKQYMANYQNDKENINFKLNLNFISDLFYLLEKWGEKKEKQILFNMLYIMTNYSYINLNKLLSKMLLSSKGYKIWELCFDFQDYEIMSQLVWILGNITYRDEQSSYNLLKSNFFKNKILNFYSNSTIINHLNESNGNNIFYIILERGLSLFNNLLSIECLNISDKEEKYKLSISIFNLLLKYSESNSHNIYYLCIYSISNSIISEIRLTNLIDKSNLMNGILNKKFFSDEELIIYNNKIIGQYTSYKSNLPQDYYDKCVNYEMDALFKIKLLKGQIELFWVLTNILHDNRSSSENIIQNEPFIDKALDIYKNVNNFNNNIYNMSNFFYTLVQNSNLNCCLILDQKGIVNIILGHLKNQFKESKQIKILFDLIYFFLDSGDLLEKNMIAKNIFKEKCDNFGLIHILQNYENSGDNDLDFSIYNIINNYYKNE